MGLSFHIKAEGAQSVERRLASLLRSVSDLTPLMSTIAAFFRETTRQRFEDGRSPEGAAWKPSIRARLHGGQTLVDHGILRDSIADDHGRDYAAVGTNDPRAAMLHFGGRIVPRSAGALVFQIPGAGWVRVKAVTMPARPFLGLGQADVGEIGAIIDDYLAGAVA